MEFVVEPPAAPFLDRLRAKIRSTGSWSADDRWDEDHLIEQVWCCPLGGKLADLEIELTLRWNPDGSFENIQILPTQAVDGWEEPVRQLLLELVQKTETQPTAFQTRHRFTYVGWALDGEYFLGDIRVAPAELPDEQGVNVERVVIIDSQNAGVDVSQAHAIGYDRANDVIGLLAVLRGWVNRCVNVSGGILPLLG